MLKKIRVSYRSSGFTLPELLVVISIIAVVTSALGFVVAGAQQRARELRTRSQLQRIESILQREILELLEVRIPVRTPPVGDFNGAMASHANAADGAIIRNQRFWNEARRVDLISRFPYRAELVRGSLPTATRPFNGRVPGVYYLRVGSPPAIAYFHGVPNELTEIARSVSINKTTIDTAGLAPDSDPPPRKKTDSSELLYAVLSRTWVDGEPAISLLRESEIGDSDDDGIKEILDVWGNPIYFRLELQIPVVREVPGPAKEGLLSMPLDEYSAWMTRFTWKGQEFRPLPVAPEVFSPERVRVRVYSSNIESNFDPDIEFTEPFVVETL